MSLSKAKELRQKAASLNETNQQLVDKVEEEQDGEWRGDQEQEWEDRDEEVESLLSRAERLERTYDREKELATTDEPEAGREDPDGGREDRMREIRDADDPYKTEAYQRAIWDLLRNGTDSQSPGVASRESIQIIREAEKRQQTTQTGSTGGHTLPTEMADQIRRGMKDFGGLRRSRATVMQTGHGRDIEFPLSDDTGNSASILAENTQETTVTDVTFTKVTLGAFKYSADLIKVPFELLQDEVFDLEALFVSALEERLGRGTEAHYTTGTGSSQPNGVVTAASVGKTTAAVDDVTFDELLDLKHAVDPAFRRQGAEWMFNDSTLKVLKKKKDGQGRPLWKPGISSRSPATIDDDPYVINQEMADLGTSNKPIAYGDMSRYVIRDVAGIRVRRLVERFADSDQIAFLAFFRTDGDLMDAGQKPVQVIQNA